MVNIKNYAVSLVISFLITIIGISVSSVIFAYTNINDIHLQTFVFGIILFSVLVGAMILSRKIKQRGLIFGAIFGIIYCLIVYLSSAIAYTGFFMSNTLLIYLVICFFAGIVGGIIGVNI